MSHISINLHKAKSFVGTCLESGLVPFIRSSPGIGKSSIVKDIADSCKLQLIDLRLSQCDPTDLNGLPTFEGHTAKFVPFNTFPLKGADIPSGKNGWLLFLDEFNSASRAVSAAAYKLVLDRKVGDHALHPQVYIVCAGNLDTDRAITNPMSSALTSRLVNLFVDVDTEDWIKHFAIPKRLDKRVVAYLNMRPSNLMTFDSSMNQTAYACPRSWEFASKLLGNIPDYTKDYIPLLAGVLGEDVAMDLQVFSENFKVLPDFKAIEANPKKVEVPSEVPVRWVVTVCLVDKVLEGMRTNPDSKPMKYEAYAQYMDRFDITFKIMFYRMILNEHPKLISNPITMKVAKDLVDYFKED